METGAAVQRSPRECPNCGLLSDPNNVACDCGYNFETGQVEAPASTPFPDGKVAEFRSPQGETIVFLSMDDLREALVSGEVTSEFEARWRRVGEGEPAWVPIPAFAKTDFALQCLYTPVWAHACKGALYGMLAVAGLKGLESLVALFEVSPINGLALVLLLATAIPKVGQYAWYGIGFLFIQGFTNSSRRGPNFGLLMGVIVGIAIFAITAGASAGFLVGAAVGFVRRRTLGAAADARPETRKVVPVAALCLLGVCVQAWVQYMLYTDTLPEAVKAFLS